MTGRLIGSNRREAIDWVQDLLLTTRPIAERAVLSALAEGKAVERADGILLFEDEQEIEKRARQQVKPISNRRGIRLHKGRGNHASHRSAKRALNDGYGRFSTSKEKDPKQDGE